MIVFFVSIVTILYIIYLLFFSRPHGIPPGPISPPIIGYSPWIDRDYPNRTWEKLRKEYGEMIGYYEGNNLMVLVNGWKAVTDGLQTETLNYRPVNIVTRDISNGKDLGVIFMNGQFWKTQRRFSLFHLKNLGFGKKCHELVIQEVVLELIERFRSEKGPFVAQVPLGLSSINILWSIVGGERFSLEDEKLAKLVSLINKAFRAGQSSGGVVFAFPFLRHIFPNISEFKTVLDAFKGIFEFIMVCIKEHKKNFDADNPRDFIDVYLNETKTKDSHDSFTDEQLAFLVSDLFSAGTETSASFLTFAIMYLCLFPEKQQVLQCEIDEVVGTSRLPNMDDKSRLVQMDAFLQEVLRIRCPAQMAVPHYAIEDTTLQGFRIPKGTMVHFNLYSVHMDEEYWGDPHTFRPERFIENGHIKKYERMIPFGKGKRMCLGEPLARMTAYLTFSALVQRFTFSFPPGQVLKDTEGKMGFTLGPPEFSVIVKERSI